MSDDKISMNHGAGGEVMANLISSTILDNITKKSVNKSTISTKISK